MASTVVPADVIRDGVIWDDSKQARLDAIAFNHAANELSRRFSQWLRVKKMLDDEWKADAERQLAAVSESVERDRLLAKLETEQQGWFEADERETVAYLEELAKLIENARQKSKKIQDGCENVTS